MYHDVIRMMVWPVAGLLSTGRTAVAIRSMVRMRLRASTERILMPHVRKRADIMRFRWAYCRHGHQSGNGFAIHQNRLVMVIGQQDADHVLAGGSRAMAEASLDEVAAKVAVHAVVRPSGDIAAIAGRIDLHMHMAASAVVAALTGREQREVAPH